MYLSIKLVRLILSYLSSHELYKIARKHPFGIICNWSFWRLKASTDFKVSPSYFDLGIHRSVSASYRYLEIETKISLTSSSLASIESNSVSGIYEVIPNLIHIELTEANLGNYYSWSRTQTLISMIYTREEEALDIVRNNLNIPTEYLIFCLRASLNIGHEQLYFHLIKLIGNRLPKYTDFSESESIGNYHLLTSPLFPRHTYLIDALVGANQRLISEVQEELSLTPEQVFKWVCRGVKSRRCHPEAAFELIKKYQGKTLINPPADVIYGTLS